MTSNFQGPWLICTPLNGDSLTQRALCYQTVLKKYFTDLQLHLHFALCQDIKINLNQCIRFIRALDHMVSHTTLFTHLGSILSFLCLQSLQSVCVCVIIPALHLVFPRIMPILKINESIQNAVKTLITLLLSF